MSIDAGAEAGASLSFLGDLEGAAGVLARLTSLEAKSFERPLVDRMLFDVVNFDDRHMPLNDGARPPALVLTLRATWL